MTPQIRNSVASLCFKHLKLTDPAALEIMVKLVTENVKSGTPHYSAGYIYDKFLQLRKSE